MIIRALDKSDILFANQHDPTLGSFKAVIDSFRPSKNCIRPSLFSPQIQQLLLERLENNIFTYVAQEQYNSDYPHARNFGIVRGTASLILERKLIHGGAICGHIEDVVVDPRHRGKGIGQQLIEKIIEDCENNKECYKVILDCEEELESFYAKSQMNKVAICMRINT